MKMIIILPLVATLSACSVVDRAFDSDPNRKIVIEDKSGGEVDAVVREQATFEWSEDPNKMPTGAETESLVPAMSENAIKNAVTKLKTSGGKLSLYFNFDVAKINQENIQEIEKHVRFMQENPDIKLRIEGHADERGTRDYNLALGENRALSVKKMFESHEGLSARIEVISYGEEQPKSRANDESGWRQNRRVEFVYQ